MVAGRLAQRDYWLTEGSEKHTVHEIQVTDVGPSLLRATVKVTTAAAAADPGSDSEPPF